MGGFTYYDEEMTKIQRAETDLYLQQQKLADIKRRRLPYQRMALGKAIKRGEQQLQQQHQREIERLKRMQVDTQAYIGRIQNFLTHGK